MKTTPVPNRLHPLANPSQWFFGFLLTATVAFAENEALGVFAGHGDVGSVAHAGAVQYDAQRETYTVAGGGENMWFGVDGFHFVWARASGDASLAADIQWLGTGGNPHRKACLLVRQDLEPGSAYADAVVHGDGLTSLQYRETSDGPTREIRANLTAPARLRIEKEGEFVAMSLAREGEALRPAGGSFKLVLKDPFYVGLGVCAHDNKVLERAVFSKVMLTSGTRTSRTNRVLESTLEVVPVASKDRQVVYHTRSHIEAPNWSRDGQYFLFNSQGRIYRLPREGGQPVLVDTAWADRCNNDHGISPDGSQLVISHHGAGGKSFIYLLPITGGTPRQVTSAGPSYWHGWSPDGRTLVYCAERNGEYDVYSIGIEGGEERRLTTAPGLDDGPDYSPDGRHIYFNSERSGSMQIWQIDADGTNPQQLTADAYNNWFPHPSPDGRWIVFLSYAKDVQGHPANHDVMLRLRPVGGGEIQVLAKLFGGQGTINVPSWSPDSRQVAFVSYRLVAE